MWFRLLFLPMASAYFIINCNLVALERLDPIVSPGKVSSHVHAVMGGSDFKSTYEYENSVNAKCTTCVINIDKSNYWVPDLYWYNATGDLTYHHIPVHPRVYYLQRGNEPEIVAPPEGLVMIAGDMMRRSYNDSNAEDHAITFVCLDYYTSHHGDPDWAERENFFNHNCPEGMRAQLFFPSCWDGVNLDSADHKSHMAYPGPDGKGPLCPLSHPVRIVSIFFEFIYSVDQFPFYPGVTNWVFSTGDTTGYGYHGDYTMGWPRAILQEAIDTCGDFTGGDVAKCPVLFPYYDPDMAGSCTDNQMVVNEDVGYDHGILSLPGCNPLWNNGTIDKPGCATMQPTPNFISAIPQIPNWADSGCYSEASHGRALNGASLTNDDETMSIEQCVSFCASQNFLVAGVEFSKCFCGQSLQAGSVISDPANCNMGCNSNLYETCGGSSFLNIWQNTQYYYSDCLDKWNTIGCVAENPTGRLLAKGKSYSTGTNMTREYCGAYCQSQNYTYMGLESGSECFCSNALSMYNSTTLPPLLPFNSCGHPCTGDATEYCGGSSTINLYKFDNKTVCPVPLRPVSASEDSQTGTKTNSGSSSGGGSTSYGVVIGAAVFVVVASALIGGYFIYRRRHNRMMPIKEFNASSMGLDTSVYTSAPLNVVHRPRGPRNDFVPSPQSPSTPI